jgi:ssDNA-binding Zn-finger/Zn-ribbon topoisomerase 1
MTDIFDTTVLCPKCKNEMEKSKVLRNGFELRALKCGKCNETILHPADLSSMEHFKDLKGKTFNVKLRMVGNSHAISIPKEIVDFMNETHKEMKREMDNMVKLCFDSFDKLSVRFGEDLRTKERDLRWGDR